MFHGADGSAVVQLLVFAEPGAFRQMLAETLSIVGGLDVTAAGWNERPQGRHDAALASLVGQPGEALQAARGLAALPKPPAVVFFDRALDRVHVLAAREMGARGYWTGQDRLEAMVAGLREAAAGRESYCPAAEAFLRRLGRRWSGRRGPGVVMGTGSVRAVCSHAEHGNEGTRAGETPAPQGGEMDQSPGTGSVRTVRCHARGNEGKGPVRGLAGLTPREIEVLILLARGATHRDCAARLGLKPKTVDNHKTRLMRDLGLHRQIELVRFAEYHGLIDGAPPGSDPAEELEYVL